MFLSECPYNLSLRKDYTSAMKVSSILFIFLFLFGITATAADAVYEVNQLVKKGKKEQALEQANAYLAAQPKGAWGRNITQMRFIKGTLLADLHRNDEAVQVFTKLIQDYPDMPEPYNNLAVLYVAQERYDDARDTLERGLRTDPAYAMAFRNLNEVYSRIATMAYDHTVRASNGGQPAPALIKDLCDNYGRMANQSVGHKYVGGEVSLIRDIPKSRSSAAAPPSKIDIDEMAVAAAPAQSALPPAFINPAVNPVPALPSVVVSAKPASPVKPESASKPTVNPAAKPATPESAAPDAEKVVLAAINGWASAWAGKNINAYLAFYAGDFRPPNGQSRAEWAKLRKERIAKPKSIRVSIDAPKVTMIDATHATVGFRQGYRSGDLQTSTHKLLLMIKKGGKWLIQEERVGG